MNDYIKYWPVATTLVTLIVAVAGIFFRVQSIENRQDRQGEAITDIKQQLITQAAQYAELKAKIDSMSENINYIRNRIDRVTQ